MNRAILRLAIPNIISNISVPLLSTVDTALMGRLSETHIGAVGLGAMIFNLVYWNFGFLRMGTTGISAQAFGENDAEKISNTLARAFFLALFLGLLLLLFQVPIEQACFYLMNVSEAQSPLVAEYFRIRIWAAPATISLFALMGWFFGMQNAMFPLAITVFINAINIVCSYVMVRHFQMDVAGVAWGTLIAQYMGLLLALILLMAKYSSQLKHWSRERLLELSALRQFLSINRDIFIRTFCLTFSFAFFYNRSSTEGEMILAVNVILLQFVNWMSYGIDGFAFASESLVGKYTGAKDSRQLKRAIRLSFVWGMAFAVFYSLIYGLFGELLLQVFTDKPAVILAASPFLFWLILYPIISTPCYIWDGIFVGMTASKAMRETMILSLLIFLLSYFLLKDWGNNGLWAALLLFMVARGAFQWIWFTKSERLNRYF